MKNKIERMQSAFKRGHALAKQAGFDIKGSESWKNKIKEICSYYFDMMDNWAVAWSDDVPEYCNSTKNLDDPFIDDVMPRRAVVDLTLDTNIRPDGEIATEEDQRMSERGGEDGEWSRKQRGKRWREDDEEDDEDGCPVRILQHPSRRRLKATRNCTRSDLAHLDATGANRRASTSKAQSKAKDKSKIESSNGSNGGKSQDLVEADRANLRDDMMAKLEELKIKRAKLMLEIMETKLKMGKQVVGERKLVRQMRLALEEMHLEMEAAKRRQQQANDH
ncbi:hypothetical protein BGZ80_003557, partial [Entomortierella chlamydospora]